MTVSGNNTSTNISLEKASSGDALVKQLPIDSANEVWPAGLILNKADKDSDFAPWQVGDTGILGVLNEETDANIGIAAIAVFGPVNQETLKVGVTNSVSPDATLLYSLQDHHIYPG